MGKTPKNDRLSGLPRVAPDPMGQHAWPALSILSAGTRQHHHWVRGPDMSSMPQRQACVDT
jgi:hypothetical protein